MSFRSRIRTREMIRSLEGSGYRVKRAPPLYPAVAVQKGVESYTIGVVRDEHPMPAFISFLDDPSTIAYLMRHGIDAAIEDEKVRSVVGDLRHRWEADDALGPVRYVMKKLSHAGSKHLA